MKIPPRKVTAVTDQERLRIESLLNPELFAEFYLQVDLWKKQREIMRSVVHNMRTAVKACHSSSKTFTSALIALWFVAAHEDAICITTAPTYNQVQKALWGEIHALAQKSRYPFPEASLTDMKLGPKRYITGLTTSVTNQDEGVKFQGFHAKNVLVILDEAPGVEPKIWEAIEGNRAGGNVRILAIGNPTMSSGPFYDAFATERSGWNCITISAFDTPNLEGLTLEQLVDENHPGYLSDAELHQNSHGYLTTRWWVKEKYFEWGRSNNPNWDSRVLGNFPAQNDNALFSLTWLEQAKIREIEPRQDDKLTAGVDVAGPGDDETTCVIRKGPRILKQGHWTQPDARGEVINFLNPYKNALRAVNVDSIGIGWHMYTHLKEMGFPAVPINIQESSYDTEKFANSRAEFCWGLRMRLESKEICGIEDSKSIAQLAGMLYKHNARGQIEIESKDQAFKRGVHSPDRAEAVILAFAEREKRYSALEYLQGVSKDYMNKTQLSQMIKPAISENQQKCPQCEAVCVVKSNGGMRCGQCGHQWGLENLSQKRNEMQKMTRKDYLENQDAKKRYALSWR